MTTDELGRLESERRVTRAVLVEGRHRVRLHEPHGRAPAGFDPVAPTLEDAYLVLMKQPAAVSEDDSPGLALAAGAS